jgi:ribosomal protein L11 methyltransferase
LKPLWRISAVTTREADDAVAELCQGVFGQPAVSYTDIETGEVTVSVYLPQRPRHFRAALREGLARLRRYGLKTGAGAIALRKINRRDWAESWKRHFKPIEIGPALLIKPSWSKRRAGKCQAVVVLDPGLSFGTGQHPTTEFCLRQLALRRNRAKRQAFLDIGTGSGILAIAAAKLGFAPVEAFDSDPEAVRMARANARRNRVLDKVRIRRADLTKLRSRGAARRDLVCANLISSLLISERERIISRLKPGGLLVLAGILSAEFPQVQRAYESAGLNLVAGRTEREWRSGAFAFDCAATLQK